MSSAEPTDRSERPRDGPARGLARLSLRRAGRAALVGAYLALMLLPLLLLSRDEALLDAMVDYVSGENRWIVVRANLEYRALLIDIVRGQQPGASLDLASVQRGLDILYSRNEVLKANLAQGNLVAIPEFSAAIATIDTAIAEADALLVDEPGPRLSPRSAAEIEALLLPIGTALRELMPSVVMDSAQSRDRLFAQVNQQRLWVLATVVGLILASLVFIGALVLGNRQLREAAGRHLRLSRQLRESESRLRVITDSVPVLIGHIDAGERLMFVNRRAGEWFSRPASTLIDRPLSELWERASYHAILPHYRAALAGESPGFELALTDRDGVRRVAEGLFVPDTDVGGRVRGCFFVMLDATRRKQVEEQLHQAQRLEAIGQLTGGVAHDFNNLLAVIVGNLELLSSELEENPEMQSMVDRAARAAGRGADLTRQLLAYSRQQVLAPRNVDANRLIADMVGLLHRTLGESITIETAPAPDLWQCFVDPGQLEAAILNLVVNARDAMPGGGRLLLATRNVVEDGCVEIAIRDTGTGMSADVIERAFEPFFTTKEIGKGSGLGLSMVQGFARQSDGNVAIESAPGAGTTVRLLLPRASEGALQPDPPAVPAGALAMNGLVLVVEDDADVRRYLTDSLRALGLRTIAAGGATEALRHLEGEESIALIVTDIGLPGEINGYELAREARRRCAGVKILYVSGYPFEASESGKPHPPGETLTKPFARSDLKAKLAATLSPVS